jgi:TRAP transporter TAXI family solute receptor
MTRMTRLPVVALALAAATALSTAASAQNLRLMTGPQGGSWYPLGGAIQNIIQENVPGAQVQVMPGAGIINVKGVQENKADLGFGNAVSTVDGVNGDAPFEAAADNVCHLASMYFQYFQMVVPAASGIEAVADLKGKAIATQPRGNTAEQMTRAILEVNGLTYEDLSNVNFVSYSDAVSLMKDGHIEAFMAITTIPASAVMDLASGMDITVLDVSDEDLGKLKEINSGYDRRIIPGGTYPKQDEDVPTFGTWTHLIGGCDLPEDTAYQVTKALAENVEGLGSIVAAMRDLTPEEMATDVGVPLHPGAEKYYKEVGVM